MRIDAARYAGGELILTTSGPEALRLALSFKPGDYEIKKRKAKRSLDANAYAWVLMDKLAQATHIPKTEIYRNAIREIGGVSEHYSGSAKAIEKLCEEWKKKGLGWQADIFPSQFEGCSNAVLYYGSSVYDSKQMSRLIDNLIEDCRALDIETMPPDKLNAMLEAWDASAKQ